MCGSLAKHLNARIDYLTKERDNYKKENQRLNLILEFASGRLNISKVSLLKEFDSEKKEEEKNPLQTMIDVLNTKGEIPNFQNCIIQLTKAVMELQEKTGSC